MDARRYRLRAHVELRFGDRGRTAAANAVAAACAGHARLRPVGPSLDDDRPVLRVARRGVCAVEISSYSAAADPRALAEEARDLQAMLAELVTGWSGTAVDCLAMREWKLAELPASSVELDDLYSIHAVSLAREVRLHTHGLLKVACPDLEWRLDRRIEPDAAAGILRRVVDYMVFTSCPPRAGDRLALDGTGLDLRVTDAGDPAEAHAGNGVLRLSREPAARSRPGRRRERGGYFDGYTC